MRMRGSFAEFVRLPDTGLCDPQGIVIGRTPAQCYFGCMTHGFEFYDSLPKRDAFEAFASPDAYTALPDDWVVGTSDIVGSTQEIAKGRYKTVNMVGAAVISAQVNASGGHALPYVFGGDGAAFACPAHHRDHAAKALAAVQVWAREIFDIELRTAMVSVADIRAAGHDVAVARHQASEGVDYAMFFRRWPVVGRSADESGSARHRVRAFRNAPESGWALVPMEPHESAAGHDPVSGDPTRCAGTA